MPQKQPAAPKDDDPEDEPNPPESVYGGWTGSLVRETRTAARLSQGAFAKALEVNRSTVVDWESGRPISALGVGALNAFRDGRPVPGAKRETLPEAGHSASPHYGESRARLAGRAAEIESLMAYALQRQRELRAALDLAEGDSEEGYRSLVTQTASTTPATKPEKKAQ